MHVLLGKLLELVKMKQEPLRVFPRAHFPRRWRDPRTIKKRDFACADLLVEPGNQAPCMEQWGLYSPPNCARSKFSSASMRAKPGGESALGAIGSEFEDRAADIVRLVEIARRSGDGNRKQGRCQASNNHKQMTASRFFHIVKFRQL